MCYLNIHHDGGIYNGSRCMNSLDEDLESRIFWNSDTLIKNASIK